MIISVASGKGGTGKTTVATNLAFALGAKARLLDCDVEEPNAHLFLHPQMNEKEIAYTFVPQIDEAKCNYCGKCAEICRFNAIAPLTQTVLVFPEMCHSCGGCSLICPQQAISEKPHELGVIESGYAEDIEFIHGCMKIGIAMAPPLIKKVCTHIKPDKINIIDAPPGTSCPVIAAMKGCDFVIMVTEPTPFGLHDLKLGVEAVKVLGIPHGLVINRSDIGNKDVWDYAESENIPILLEIPFMREAAVAYSRGKLISKEIPEWQGRFRDLYKAIENLQERESQ